MACLYFVILHASDGRMLHLGLAAVLGSLVILTKQEFGAACLVLLTFEIAACYWIRRSPRELGRNIAVCIAGLLPAVSVYGWFVWKLSARFIFFDNWRSEEHTSELQSQFHLVCRLLLDKRNTEDRASRRQITGSRISSASCRPLAAGDYQLDLRRRIYQLLAHPGRLNFAVHSSLVLLIA